MDTSVRLAEQQVENDSAYLDEMIAARTVTFPESAVFAATIGVNEDELLDFESFPLDFDMGFVRRYSHALGMVVTHAVAPYRDRTSLVSSCWRSSRSIEQAARAYLEEVRR